MVYMRGAVNPVRNFQRQTFIGLCDAVSLCPFFLPEKLHKRNVHIAVAEALGNAGQEGYGHHHRRV